MGDTHTLIIGEVDASYAESGDFEKYTSTSKDGWSLKVTGIKLDQKVIPPAENEQLKK